MTPDRSSLRTRDRQGDGDRWTRDASSTLLSFAFSCSAARIRMSIASSDLPGIIFFQTRFLQHFIPQITPRDIELGCTCYAIPAKVLEIGYLRGTSWADVTIWILPPACARLPGMTTLRKRGNGSRRSQR